MTNWQPIETAPKDGTSILICGGTTWYTGETYLTEREFVGVTIAGWHAASGRWRGDQGEQYDEWYCHKPTHWMPLPAPYELTSDQG